METENPKSEKQKAAEVYVSEIGGFTKWTCEKSFLAGIKWAENKIKIAKKESLTNDDLIDKRFKAAEDLAKAVIRKELTIEEAMLAMSFFDFTKF